MSVYLLHCPLCVVKPLFGLLCTYNTHTCTHAHTQYVAFFLGINKITNRTYLKKCQVKFYQHKPSNFQIPLESLVFSTVSMTTCFQLDRVDTMGKLQVSQGEIRILLSCLGSALGSRFSFYQALHNILMTPCLFQCYSKLLSHYAYQIP